MSEKEKSIISKVVRAIPRMSEFDKGYLLGKAESLVEENAKGGDEDGKHDHSRNGTTD